LYVVITSSKYSYYHNIQFHLINHTINNANTLRINFHGFPSLDFNFIGLLLIRVRVREDIVRVREAGY